MRAPLIKRSEKELQKAGQRGITNAYAAHDPLPRLTAEGHFDGVRLAQKLISINKAVRARTLAKSLPNAIDREAVRVMKAGNSLGRLGLEKYLQKNPGDARVRPMGGARLTAPVAPRSVGRASARGGRERANRGGIPSDLRAAAGCSARGDEAGRYYDRRSSLHGCALNSQAVRLASCFA